MFKALFTEAKLKPLDVPLTDTERKKLETLRKKFDAIARGEFPKHSPGKKSNIRKEKELLANLEARKDIKPPKYELMTLAQIKKSGNLTYVLKGIYYAATGGYWATRYAKYACKNQGLSEEETKEFIELFKPQMQKMIKSKIFKKALIDNIKRGAEENDYWNELSSSIRSWVYSILEKSDIKDIISIDPYKLYQDVEVEKAEKSWTSMQGASMTTKTADVIFTLNGKEYKKDFHLDTSGYWNN